MTHPDPAASSRGLLRSVHETGLLSWGDVHCARQFAALYDETDERVVLAAALAVRALRAGSVCLRVRGIAQEVFEAEEATPVPADLWPEPTAWAASLADSPMVTVGDQDGAGRRPLRLVDELLYLERYWQDELVVARELRTRHDGPESLADPGAVAAALAALFPGDSLDDDQRQACLTCVRHPVSVVAGGPGTGKTTTIARILALVQAVSPRPPRVALAAPTGKAAARVEEALGSAVAGLPAEAQVLVGGLRATTLHRLLGWTPQARNRFVHNRGNPLPHDVVILDEASMIPLPLMARLLEALRPEAKLVLVGDPDQLAPVEAGAVLSDIVGAEWSGSDRPRPVVRLTRNWRFGGAIGELAAAVRAGDADAAIAVLRGGAPGVLLTADPAGSTLRADVVATGTALLDAARAGDAAGALTALDRHRLLCAHRRGPYGVAWWSRQVEEWLAEAVPGFAADGQWYPGRPLLVTQNSPELGLSNGDTGVVVPTADGQPRAWFRRGQGQRSMSVHLLEAVQTVHAMTVHKAQGSQFQRVSLILPPPDSPLLTRELLYTAVTRATDAVTLIGTQEALAEAVRRPARRASGLARRL